MAPLRRAAEEQGQRHPKFNLDTSLLFNESAYSDLIINLEGRLIYCHKIIICNNCPCFADLCGPAAKFKVCHDSPRYAPRAETDTGQLQEKFQSIIDLKEDNADAMEVLLNWLYINDYSDIARWMVMTKETPAWRLHLDVMLAADKYILPELEIEATAAICTSIEHVMFTAADAASMLEAIHGMDVTTSVADIAEKLQYRMLPSLLKESAFRALVDNSNEYRWKVLDSLATSAGRHATMPADIRVECQAFGCRNRLVWKTSEAYPIRCSACGFEQQRVRSGSRME